MKLKKLLSHTAIYGFAPYVTKVASLVVMPIITKDLTADDYGVAGIVTGYTGLFLVLSTLGLPTVLSNTFFKHKYHFKWVWRHIYGFLSIWNFVYGAFIALLLLFLLQSVVLGNNLFLVIVLTMAPIVFFGPTRAIGSLYYQLQKKPVQVVWRTILFGVLTIGLNLYTISYLKMGFMGWFWSDFIVGILFNLSYWYAMVVKNKVSPIYRFKWATIKRYIKISLPVVPHQYATFMLRSSDRAILGFLNIPNAQVGKYSLAANFGNYFYSVSSALGVAVNPFVLLDIKDNRQGRVKYLVFLLQTGILLVTFNFALWSNMALKLLVKNDELAQAYPLVIIVVMAFSYRPMYIGATSVLFFFEKTKSLLKVSFVAGVGNVMLNLIFIPIVGYEFAAYSTFICYMYIGYSGFFLKEFKQISGQKYYPLFWLLLTTLLTLTAYVVVDLNILLKGGVTALSLLIGLYFGWQFKKKVQS